MKLRFLLLVFLFGFRSACLYSQSPSSFSSSSRITDTAHFGLKSNLLYDLTGSFSLGFEFKTGRKFTLDVPVSYNPWTFSDNRKWKHILVQPEFRYWLCEPFYGHFLGVHAHYSRYNVGNLPFGGSSNVKDYRYDGWLIGGGFSYGYHWLLSSRWSMEASLGVGYAYLDYDKHQCERCGEKLKSDSRHYVGITKAALSLIYIIK